MPGSCSASRSCSRTTPTARRGASISRCNVPISASRTNVPRGLSAARELIAAFKGATSSPLAREILDRAMAAAEADDCYAALKLARRIIRHEDTVLGAAGRPGHASRRVRRFLCRATMRAARAYQASSDSRSLRMQEADVFHRANGALRTALGGSRDRPGARGCGQPPAVADRAGPGAGSGKPAATARPCHHPVRRPVGAAGNGPARPGPRFPDRGQRERGRRVVVGVMTDG